MKLHKNYHCVIVGQGTLAIRCCQFLIELGINIDAILPLDSIFFSWSKKEGIKHLNTINELEVFVSDNYVEWLFSISNPIILDSKLLSNIKLGAFNYHDAPLPKYAGTHATSWAILALEKKYAVTWHEVISKVDAGNIVIQKNVEINQSDTALSLNMKCYHTAFEGFKNLIVLLDSDNIEYIKQDLSERSFFSNRKRPYSLACLQWNKSAEELSALVRGLYFGERYRNPLCMPKVYLMNTVGIVKSLEVLSNSSHEKPGFVVDISRDCWVITTATTDIRIEFMYLAGEYLRADIFAYQLDINVGNLLPNLSDSDSVSITQKHEDLVSYELFWVERLEFCKPLKSILTNQKYLNQDCAFDIYYNWNLYDEVVEFKSEERLWHILSALAIYLSLSNDVQNFHLAWKVGLFKNKNLDYSCFFSDNVPFEFCVNFDNSALDLYNFISIECDKVNKYKTFTKDIVFRYPQLRLAEFFHSKFIFGIDVINCENIENSLTSPELYEKTNSFLTMQIEPNKRAFRWISNLSMFDSFELRKMTNEIINIDRILLSNPSVPLKKLFS
ncbi:formyltransferase family protein [Xenorhabdus doucetiae]|uniref:Methionyl-tRNA formyltransferase n=1 Tax=Xenorhabdus doucetiae TaxID=351671 RepID=A0A068QX05_9GAMM|nr:formyltransferase family protein [Xenorhabdus doucetiae]TYO94673.1 methionyl-tRNA formyltransferase [Xenorhabdus doucetiae]CDG19562.1 putative Methionyl-tRNA formyltransferase [Xenorhabdus doucetiae]